MARLKLTKKFINDVDIPAGKRTADVYDEAIPKMVLRVTPTAKTFYVVKRDAGQMQWVKLGRWPELQLEAAREAAAKVLGAFAAGENPAAVRRAQRAEQTFAEVFGDFLQNRLNRQNKPLSDKTKADYTNVVELYMGAMSKRKLSEITADDVARLHRVASRTTPAGANKLRAVISSVFSYAIRKKLFKGQKPTLEVARNPEVSRSRFLSESELPRFFDALNGLSNPMMRDFFLLAILTGARRSNLCAMHWRDVSIEDRTWVIPKTKNGDPQTVALTAEAIGALENRMATTGGQGWVFPSSGKTGHLIEPKKAWASLCAAAKLDNLRIHDLRRTLATWQVSTGANVVLIAKTLGHKSLRSTEVYARADQDPVRRSMQTATAAILSAGQQKPPAEVVHITKAA
jgi:integrase